MPAVPIIPFVLMLTVVPLPLVPIKPSGDVENNGAALVENGDPEDARNGPMYAELVDGAINDDVKVFFKNYTQRYYYRVEEDNETLSITTVSNIHVHTRIQHGTCMLAAIILLSLYRIQKRQPSFKFYLPQIVT